MSATAFQRKRREEKLKAKKTQPKALDEMTVKELISYAKDNNISLGELKKKDDILQKIKSELSGDGADEREDNTEA